MAGIIHSPTHERRDFLVDELQAKRLNMRELLELRDHLEDMVACAEEADDKPALLAGAFLLAMQEQQLSAKQRAKRKGKL